MEVLPVKLPDQANPDPELVLLAGGSLLVARVLANRGLINPKEVRRLIDPLAEPEPDLGDYPPLAEAVALISRAIKDKRRIAVYGDYDVDGITATAVLINALTRLGADCLWHIPHRFNEGYGMHPARIKTLHDQGVSLIITADCGISNLEEIALARALGMAVVVTDHHTPPEVLPQANVIVNLKQLPPQHPSRDLPGVGTAFILSRWLLEQHGQTAEDLLDLVALGVVADVVPLLGHNRQLLKKGLPLLVNRVRPGLAALYQASRLDPKAIDEETLAFQVVPRLNAAGRLEDGSLAVRLLLAEDLEGALPLAESLNRLNQERKALGRKIQEQVKAEAGKPIVAYQDDWHQGVVGIAAGHLAQKHRLPALLMTKSRQGEIIVGSARSLPGVDIYQALSRCADFLLKFGGHPAAAGFSVHPDRLKDFCQAISRVLAEELEGLESPILNPDLALPPKAVTLATIRELALLAPFGEANPRPVCYCDSLTVKSLRQVTSGWLLTLGDRWHTFGAGLWNADYVPQAGNSIRAAFTLTEYRRQSQEPEVQATLLHWWPGEIRPLVERVSPEYTDLRQTPPTLARLAEAYPGAALFREGLSLQQQPGADRNNLQPNDKLVLGSAPASAALLRQILAMVSPREVVLAQSISRPNLNSFIGELGGTVKYTLNHLGGRAGLIQLAAALAVTEPAILAGLDVLKEMNLIEAQVEQGEIFLEAANGASCRPSLTVDTLRRHLEEAWHFHQWLMQASIDEIKEIQA